jgi:hypothetical protein
MVCSAYAQPMSKFEAYFGCVSPSVRRVVTIQAAEG